ncbi:uncharacterized protein LOC130561809 isoform X2 [Triplophysa rosa]|uniref:uncharacterized protein LOC130561809 isoform X2 n=1 Tax=Triplophysa rosa TaxID=992332 RepID=UPI002545FC6E|nr:uncharacterized protein LOC130561809 isoform X2 [Triplophysa rosa]
MDLGFFTDQYLFRFFCKNKTKMSTISDPVMLLRHLKDHKIIEEALEFDPEDSEESVYGVMDFIGKRGEKHVRKFWNCVNQEHILGWYREIYELIQTLKNESGLSPDLSSVVAVENETSERSERRQSMEEPSTSFTETPLYLWDMPEHKRWLPVKCGEIEGLLDRDRLFRREQNFIQIEGHLIKPFQFEDMGGKGSSKNWKMSILCQGTPLKTLIERDILKVSPYEGKLVLHK